MSDLFQDGVEVDVLNPTKDRTHYHLGYVTHSDKGLVTFREDELRARYVEIATARLDGLMRDSVERAWDDLIVTALQVPMISEADVKNWLKAAQHHGVLDVVGLDANERVAKRERNHRVRRR